MKFNYWHCYFHKESVQTTPVYRSFKMEVVGQLYKHFDEAGLLTVHEYDFKGNVLQKTREVISDSEILAVFNSGSVSSVDCYRVDWEASPQMEGNYQTDIEYDALNRVIKMKYPEDTDQERKELTPTYNRAGALESVVFDGDTYVDHIAYNARGQRLMIALGNDIMTRYAYDNKTFRLTRICSEKYQKNGWLYSPDGGVKQDTAYNYDLAGNIISTNDESPNSGVEGSGSLEREFSYDPLYRLLSATGRENAPTISPIWDDSYRSDDHTQTTAYTQKYNYDKMGNILRLKHMGNSDFTRIFNPDSDNMPNDYGNKNLLNEVKIGSTNYSFQYDANGNLIQENADRFYEWDATDQMRCFFIDDGNTITKHAHYLYDAAGNRVKKLVRVDGGNYTSNTYIDGVFERKTDGNNEQNSLHIMDDASRIALIRLGDAMGDSTPPVKYILEDHLGSSVMELKDDGQNIFKEEYYPFGETSFGSHAFKRYKYNGKERDGESGLYYYGQRFYCPWTCRFISLDPKSSETPNLTPYHYTSNNPINRIDPDGLQDEPSEGVSDAAVVSENNVTGIEPSGETEPKAEGGGISIAYTDKKSGESGYYKYGSGDKLPKDKLLRKTVRTLDKIQRRGGDTLGIIDYLSKHDSNTVIRPDSSWKGRALAAAVLETTYINWSPKSGYVSPDGSVLQAPALALLHELAESYYTLADPEGKVAEYPFLFKLTQMDFNHESFIEKLNEAETLQKQEVGEYDTWSDKWIIENVEPGFNKAFRDKNRNTHSGFGTKVIFGPFSKLARRYYNHKTNQVRRIKDLKK